jgi:hypothetical protein
MLYLILGHLCACAAAWVCILTIVPLHSASMIWLGVFCFFGEGLVMLFFDADSRSTIRDALKAQLLSRWLVFTAGVVGALFWILTTAITLSFALSFESILAVTVGAILTLIWTLLGMGGSIGYITDLAKERLAECSSVSDISSCSQSESSNSDGLQL